MKTQLVAKRDRFTHKALLLAAVLSTLFITPESLADVVTLAPDFDARILAVVDDRSPEFLAVYNVGTNIQRSLILFDLAGLPAAQTIDSASMTLFSNISYGGNPSNLPMDIFRVTRPWVESEATWNNSSDSDTWTNPGGDFVGLTGLPGVEPYSVSTADPTSDDQAVTWDITKLVKEWHEGIYDNDGLLLLSQPGNKLVFHGTGFADSTVHPKLELTLSAPILADPPTGDFNEDRTVDSKDVNLLASEIAAGTNRPAFDLNVDSLVNRLDLSLFLGGDFIDGGNKLNGDADFDGSVDFLDFLVLSLNFNLKNRTWTEGDFDANGDIEFPDFLLLSANFGKSASAVAAVSEPSAGLLTAFGILGLFGLRHRR